MLVFHSFPIFLFVQQIQYGRRSLKPLLKTQSACCLLSQTGLRCHGNMLWRSTYWDSAGWQVSVLAVWVSGLLFPHKHPAIPENLQHTAVYRAVEVCLRLHLIILCVCVGLCFFVCSMLPKTPPHLITASDVSLPLQKLISLCRLQKQFHLVF